MLTFSSAARLHHLAASGHPSRMPGVVASLAGCSADSASRRRSSRSTRRCGTRWGLAASARHQCLISLMLRRIPGRCLRTARTFGAGFGIDGARFVPGWASAGARRGHFNTKDTNITKGTKRGHGAFAAEMAGDQPRDDLKTSFAAFVSKCPRPPRTQSFTAESMTSCRRARRWMAAPPLGASFKAIASSASMTRSVIDSAEGVSPSA